MKRLLALPLLLIIAGCATSSPMLAKEYLDDARAGLPRETSPYVVERIDRRDKDLVTVMTVDTTKLDFEAIRKAQKANNAAIVKEFGIICQSTYFDDLRAQGFRFMIDLTVITKSNTSTQFNEVVPAECRTYGY